MDSMRPLVSVILPVHDGAGFLPGALSVIRIQDYRPLQIIVVDDGSRDETARIAERSSDVLVLRLERNRGPAAARNAGLSRAEGEFVAFLDVDDHWPPGTLLHQVERLVTDPAADVALGLTQPFFEDEEPVAGGSEPAGDPIVAPQLGSALFRKSVFERVGGFDERLRYSEDQDWFLRAREQRIEIRLSQRVTLLYRVHASSLTRKTDRPRDFQLLAVLKRSLDRRRKGGSVRTLPPLARGEETEGS